MKVEEVFDRPGLYDHEVVSLLKDMAQRIIDLEKKINEKE